MASILFVTWRTLDGPFSAVSRPTIARLDAFFSIFQNLHVVRSLNFLCTTQNSIFCKKNLPALRAKGLHHKNTRHRSGASVIAYVWMWEGRIHLNQQQESTQVLPARLTLLRLSIHRCKPLWTSTFSFTLLKTSIGTPMNLCEPLWTSTFSFPLLKTSIGTLLWTSVDLYGPVSRCGDRVLLTS